ncbi:unannotated protein [freshwater metagenome]|uniref:Unannotated protein n=1 Tax=freshwater metagenome TaxID=449393 RepID=A0A6J6F5L9_9ZZZZ|nr:hypothetical protein [Actinomycetota bacterium]MSZ90227.1 hypothetical protein [Actinomycetota bacterium]
MKLHRVAIVLISTLMFSTANPVLAADTVPTREEQVAQFHAKYDPLYDAQYARLMVINSKITNNASMLPSFKLVVADFLGVRKFLDTSLSGPTAELETIVSYADEELGEFANTIYLMETQVSKSKTITCVKGKTIKKVMALKPVCPKGYIKK